MRWSVSGRVTALQSRQKAASPSAVTLVVADDGCGFAAADRPPGFGLTGMRERVEEVGGRVSVDSHPGAGTRLTVSVPA